MTIQEAQEQLKQEARERARVMDSIGYKVRFYTPSGTLRSTFRVDTLPHAESIAQAYRKPLERVTINALPE